MSRKIKFRAWHKAFGMSRPYTAFKDGGIVHFDSVSKGALGDFQNHASITQAMDWMQFTGLHDMNGKEIYEGDFVYLAGYGDYLAEFPFDYLYDAAAEKDIGAIKGNIYENPELMA